MDGSFVVGHTYLATNSLKREDKRILALTSRDGNRLTFAVVSGVVEADAVQSDYCSEYASQVYIDGFPFFVPSTITPSLDQLVMANAALLKARAAV